MQVGKFTRRILLQAGAAAALPPLTMYSQSPPSVERLRIPVTEELVPVDQDELAQIFQENKPVEKKIKQIIKLT